MMKKITANLLLSVALSSVSWAQPTPTSSAESSPAGTPYGSPSSSPENSPPGSPEIERKKKPQGTMEIIFPDRTTVNKVTIDIAKGQILSLNPSTTLVVLDVDGTLTNHPSPTEKYSTPLGPRGESVGFVNELIDKGFNVVLSSAWAPFDETLGRLKVLGLLEKVGASEKGSCEKNIDFDENIKVTVCKSGRVVSVQDESKVNFQYKIGDSEKSWMANTDGYFRQKAFSFKFAEPAIDPSKITDVVFVDDSGGNIDYWNMDIARTGIFEKANIKAYLLLGAKNDPEVSKAAPKEEKKPLLPEGSATTEADRQ